MIKRLLLVSDDMMFAERAGDFAINLASQLRCDVYGLFIYDSIEYLAGEELVDAFVLDREVIINQLKNEGKKALEEIRALASTNGVNFDGALIRGEDPVAEIFEIAQKKKVDMIIVGLPGKTGAIDGALGLIPARLLHAKGKSPCPITILPNSVTGLGQALDH